ncbi:MAG TPA: peptidase, partial [Planctomycetaceae bacterium]|nr:peptidase [Planctomycetaceae bacterium]
PTGFQRGTTVEATFAGARLEDAQELLFYEPGITVKKITPVNANQIKATLEVAPSCRLGIHAVRVRTATGISNLRTFTVGALPVVEEKEPNSDFASPQPIPLDTTVSGIVQNEDVDYFVVEAKKGERISAELEGIRLGYTFFDPYVAILDAKRFELARSDDFPLLRQDSLCTIVAPEDGKYIIEVRESAFGGNGNCHYRLHVGRFPRPIAVFPPGGRPGETLELECLDATGRTWKQSVTLPTDPASDEFLFFAQDAHGIAPSPNHLRLVDLPSTNEAEPNDAYNKPNTITVPGAVHGRIGQPGDHDFFKFSAKKGQRFDIRVYARKVLRSPLDSVLIVRRAKNASGVVSNDDSGGPDSYVRFTAPEDGEFVVELYDHLQGGGPDYVYRIEIVPVTPRLTINLPERFRYVSTVISVPKGNRMAFLVNAARADFGGELSIEFPSLPPGIHVQAEKMAANRSQIPVLFTADASAKPAGALTPIIGRCEKPPVVGGLDQRTMLVRGQNNRDVWGHNTDRFAVAVTDEAPFTLELVPPKVPIVRNGTMGLKVVAKRKEGFSAAIGVRMLYNPPGISSSGAVSIPAGKNEAVIPMTASGGAAIREWPIVVIGRAGTPKGAVDVSTQMVNLKVSDHYVRTRIEKSAVEQGQETEVLVNVEQVQPFEGEAAVELVGLPAKVTLVEGPKTFTKETKQLVFKVKADPGARPGRYKSLTCRIRVPENGDVITHVFGGGELRIDKPLPKKPAPKAQPKKAAKPAPKPAPKKRLSRLEQLRQKRKQAKEGGQ